MPNWCNNALCVIGPKDLINSLFSENSFSLSKILPCPQELLDLPSPPPKEFEESNIQKYGFKDWYNWCISNWGVKWDPGPISGDIYPSGENDELLQFNAGFDSAWGPPTKAFEYLGKNYPQLRINLEYFEPGCSFFGVFSAEDGSCCDAYQEYEDADELEELLNELPCELAQQELPYIRDCEADSLEQETETSTPKVATKKAKAATKKAATKKAATKKAAK